MAGGLCCKPDQVNSNGSCREDCGIHDEMAGLCCKINQVNFNGSCISNTDCPDPKEFTSGICCEKGEVNEEGLCKADCSDTMKRIGNLCCNKNELRTDFHCSTNCPKSWMSDQVAGSLCCNDKCCLNDNGECSTKCSSSLGECTAKCKDDKQKPVAGLCCNYNSTFTQVNDNGICKDYCPDSKVFKGVGLCCLPNEVNYLNRCEPSCIDSYYINIFGLCCANPTFGKEVNNDGICISEAKCNRDSKRVIYGLCCKPNYSIYEGVCIEECPEGKFNVKEVCCKRGEVVDNSGNCISKCDNGQVIDGNPGKCLDDCMYSTSKPVGGLCCQIGQFNDYGICEDKCKFQAGSAEVGSVCKKVNGKLKAFFFQTVVKN